MKAISEAAGNRGVAIGAGHVTPQKDPMTDSDKSTFASASICQGSLFGGIVT
jgi:hypothetical protein